MLILNLLEMLSKVSIAAFALLTLTGLRLTSAQSRCFNPNRRNGVCISIYDCPALKALLQKKPLPPDDRRFLQEAQCSGGAGRQPHVCCNEDSGYVTFTTEQPQTATVTTGAPSSPSNGKGNVLPSPPACGIGAIPNKIYNGNDTALDEFPWMVLLEYRQRNGQKIMNCGGSLINQRYVLTAAHCVTGDILQKIGSLVTVRLGEYDLSQRIDCVDSDCNEPVVEVGIEEVKPHEDFSDRSPSRHNDIALIRLNRDVTYTDFIRPVCLPSAVSLERSQPGIELIVAGWGRTLQSRQSSIKQKLSIPASDHNLCKSQFASRKVEIIDSQLCAGGRYAEDSCDGDSGGPLMRQNNNYWAIEGIVSFGNKCGLENWPAVYTRVSSYENWIRNNLKP